MASMAGIAQMDRMLRQDMSFLDYMSIRHREKELARLDQRIQALQSARRTLETTPVARIPRRRYKSAQNWCRSNDWTDEDAIHFMHDYGSKQPPPSTSSSTNVSAMLSGLSRVGQALLV